jgi:hypothetical protein
MTPDWRIRTVPLTIALAIAGLRLATLPKDPCALLKPAEIQDALAGNAGIGTGVANTATLPMGVGCTYTWGQRTKEYGESQFTITVIDATKAWPNTDADVLEQGLRAKAQVGGPNASVIYGVGNAGAFTYEARSFNATAEAYFASKNLHLSVTFHEGDSLQRKDKLIALLKAAGTRL